MGLVVGALAGFAVGMLMAQKMGGLSGIADRLRTGLNAAGAGMGTTRRGLPDPVSGDGDMDDEFEEFDEDDIDDLGDDEDFDADDFEATLEERVLEAFRNDPILSECAIDIGAIGDGIIELAGMVDTERDAEHAVTVARGVPDVETVVNRMLVGTEESVIAETARRLAEGDPALTEAHWEGQQVGIGRRRQGTSDEFDRHADPKPKLEERWLRQNEALLNAAEEDAGSPGKGNRNKKSVKQTPRGGRTDGSPVAPTGVAKGDHVADPESAPDTQRAD
jgi:hypothetical protein